ncbi:MAG: DUF4136 domain-containing protein [Cytophagaceae bacterium]|jgi:hypothetical protein|nr:DUF4136 domain-containing protein [Cytophagaceae bacterium]
MKKIIFGLGVIALLAASSKPSYFVNKNKEVDFKTYKSFAWIAPFDTIKGQMVKKRPYEHFIAEQVDKVLLSKGYVLDSIQPDIVLMYDARIQHDEKVKEPGTTQVSVGMYVPYYYGNSYYGGSTFDPDGYRGAGSYPAGSAYYGGYCFQATKQVSGNKPPKKYVVEKGYIVFNAFDTKTKQNIWSAGANEKIDIETDIGSELLKIIQYTFTQFPAKQ